MQLDIRTPMGLLFSILGIVLGVYGMLSPPATYQKSLGIDVNLLWGVVILGFGVLMLTLARHAKMHAK